MHKQIYLIFKKKIKRDSFRACFLLGGGWGAPSPWLVLASAPTPIQSNFCEDKMNLPNQKSVPHYSSLEAARKDMSLPASVSPKPNPNVITAADYPSGPMRFRAPAPGYFTAPAINDASFQRIIESSAKPIIVIFTTVGCGACKAVKDSAWQALHKNYKDQFDLYEFTCTEATKKDKEEDITGHPCMLFYNKGEQIGVYMGYSQYEYYVNYIKTLKIK